TMVCHFGPGMDSAAKITSWEPPHRITAESDGFGPGSPTMATEWTVEARSGGKCLVRVVHSLFASTDDWDDQLEGTESGWPAFFRILRLYLAHFPGQRSATFQLAGMAPGTATQIMEKLESACGLSNAPVGQRQSTGADVPSLTG